MPINPIIINILPFGNLGMNKPSINLRKSGLVITAVMTNETLIIITKNISDFSKTL